MSIHILKKKTDAKSHTSGSTNFTINGGPRNLSYIGKSTRNSSVRTPFRGVTPMGFNGNRLSNNIVMAFPHIKAELGQTHDNAPQMSVRSTKSMIATKYKWIKGQYPNVWVQPSTNQSSSDRTAVASMAILRTDLGCDGEVEQQQQQQQQMCCDKRITEYPLLGNRKTSSQSIINRLIGNNMSGSNIQPSVGFSDYMTRLQAASVIQSGANKPFPYYVNKVVKSGGCAGRGEEMPIYHVAPEWYKIVGTGTQAENERCGVTPLTRAMVALTETKNIALSAMKEADTSLTTWYESQAGLASATNLGASIVLIDQIKIETDEAEAVALARAIVARDAYVAVVAAALVVYNLGIKDNDANSHTLLEAYQKETTILEDLESAVVTLSE